MSLRFRKSIKILPGVRLNLSKSGVSTTIGVRGASVNVGKRGTFLNAGIPGTGISERTKLSGPADMPSTPQPKKARNHKPLIHLALFFGSLLLVGMSRSGAAVILLIIVWAFYAVVMLGIRLARKISPQKPESE